MSNGVKKAETPYPTAYAIEDMFNHPASRHEAVISAIDDNVDSNIMGYDHHFAGGHKGKEALLKNVMEDFSGMINEETVSYEVVNVIGGGESPWAAVEGKATAKSKTGNEKPPRSVLTGEIC